MTIGFKNDRAYSDAERALFAEYRKARARFRPAACIGGEQCWVEYGPPAYRARSPAGQCLGCGSAITTIRVNAMDLDADAFAKAKVPR